MKPALKLVSGGPSNDEIARYYFEIDEAIDMLKCSESALIDLLDEHDFGQVLMEGKWYLPPDLGAVRIALWGDK